MRSGYSIHLACLLALAFVARSFDASALLDDTMNVRQYRAAEPERGLENKCNTEITSSRQLLLYDVVSLTLCNNPQTRSTWIGALASADNFGDARTAYLPTVSGTAGSDYAISRSQRELNTRAPSYSSGLSVGYLLYDFGKREISIEQAKQTLLAANYSYSSALQTTIFTAISDYFQYQSALETLQTAEDNRVFSQQSLDAAKLRYKNGLAAYSDVLQAQAAMSQSELDVTQGKNGVITNKGVLANVMGLSPDTAFAIATYVRDKASEKAFSMNASEAIARAKAARPDLAAAYAQVENARLALDSKHRENLPSINLSAGRSYSTYNVLNSRNGNDSIGVSVSFPFSVVGHEYGVSAAEEQLESQQLTYESTKQAAELDAFRTWHNYDTSLNSVAASEQFLASAEEVRKVTLGRYKEGVGAFIDVLNSQAQYTAARERLVAAVYGLQTGRADFIRSIGGLDTKALHEMTQAAQ